MTLPKDYSEQINSDPSSRYSPLPGSGLIPDVNDQNNYCIACERTFSNRYKYFDHLFAIHLDEIPELCEGIDCKGPSDTTRD
ncbi:hypothetical protein BDF21DRAFT_459258 [Thamnidium elegans]|uniref:C2H2-type domain-containing protein n=1 Tax=Thamnidium elegans TaxID=101142 RepID=A0A8H7VSC9_9FUNG|nr:hypothetical protein INT48_006416 [Thamnidium elegans]KAI8091575.1 hypothetical protein BDF21DRAFT_459258 [Thamnidium elegans]